MANFNARVKATWNDDDEKTRLQKFDQVLEYFVSAGPRISDEVTATPRRQVSQIVTDGMKSSGLPKQPTESKYFIAAVTTWVDDPPHQIPVVKSIIKQLRALYLILYPQPATLSVEFTRIKAAFVLKYPDVESEIYKFISEQLRAPETVQLKLRQDYEEKKFDKNRHLDPIDDSKILTIITKTSKPRDWKDAAIAVALMTGARLIEVARQSIFTVVDDQGPQTNSYIKQIGVRKARPVLSDKTPLLDTKEKYDFFRANNRLVVDGKDVPFIIKPIINGTPAQVMGLVDVARKGISQKTGYNCGYSPYSDEIFLGREGSDQNLSMAITRELGERVQELFNRRKMTFHTLRSIYASFSYNLYAPPSMSSVAWISQVLGHKPGALSTAISYQKFNVQSQSVHKRLAGIEERLDRIEQTLRANPLPPQPPPPQPPPPQPPADQPPPDDQPPPPSPNETIPEEPESPPLVPAGPVGPPGPPGPAGPVHYPSQELDDAIGEPIDLTDAERKMLDTEYPGVFPETWKPKYDGPKYGKKKKKKKTAEVKKSPVLEPKKKRVYWERDVDISEKLPDSKADDLMVDDYDASPPPSPPKTRHAFPPLGDLKKTDFLLPADFITEGLDNRSMKDFMTALDRAEQIGKDFKDPDVQKALKAKKFLKIFFDAMQNWVFSDLLEVKNIYKEVTYIPILVEKDHDALDFIAEWCKKLDIQLTLTVAKKLKFPKKIWNVFKDAQDKEKRKGKRKH